MNKISLNDITDELIISVSKNADNDFTSLRVSNSSDTVCFNEIKPNDKNQINQLTTIFEKMLSPDEE